MIYVTIMSYAKIFATCILYVCLCVCVGGGGGGELLLFSLYIVFCPYADLFSMWGLLLLFSLWPWGLFATFLSIWGGGVL